MLVLVCGSVMTSVGSKSYWKVLWERENGDELKADKEITKVMGTSLAKMQYKPKNMIFKKYSVDSEQRKATLFFQYGDQVIRYTMYTNSKDSSLGQKTVDNLTNTYEIENKGKKIQVKEYEVGNTKEKRYIAEFEYKDIQYQLKGIMEKEEFDKIIKNLFFM